MGNLKQWRETDKAVNEEHVAGKQPNRNLIWPKQNGQCVKYLL